MTKVLFLSNENVSDLANLIEYVDVVREAYRQRGRGAPTEPRTKLTTPQKPDAKFTSYLAMLPDTGVMGGYIYSANFSTIGANHVASLFDYETGELLALIEGTYMNPFKTGAAGAVGADELSREDATEVGVIGSGTQALGQIAAITTVRDIDRVQVYSPTPKHRERFASKLTTDLDVDATAVEKSSQAIDDVDIVITATKSDVPVFDGKSISEGTHLNVVGQYWPNKREVDATIIRKAKYVPDLRARAFQDAGAFLLALDEGAITEDHIHAELGDVVAETSTGRESPEEITVFDSGGTALETVAAANLLYEKAREDGRGTWLEFTPSSEVFTDLDFL